MCVCLCVYNKTMFLMYVFIVLLYKYIFNIKSNYIVAFNNASLKVLFRIEFMQYLSKFS